jgi:hypothetical protein
MDYRHLHNLMKGDKMERLFGNKGHEAQIPDFNRVRRPLFYQLLLTELYDAEKWPLLSREMEDGSLDCLVLVDEKDRAKNPELPEVVGYQATDVEDARYPFMGMLEHYDVHSPVYMSSTIAKPSNIAVGGVLLVAAITAAIASASPGDQVMNVVTPLCIVGEIGFMIGPCIAHVRNLDRAKAAYETKLEAGAVYIGQQALDTMGIGSLSPQAQ